MQTAVGRGGYAPALKLSRHREGSRRIARVRTTLGKSDRVGPQGGLRKRELWSGLYGHISRKRRNSQGRTYGCACRISIPTAPSLRSPWRAAPDRRELAPRARRDPRRRRRRAIVVCEPSRCARTRSISKRPLVGILLGLSPEHPQWACLLRLNRTPTRKPKMTAMAMASRPYRAPCRRAKVARNAGRPTM